MKGCGRTGPAPTQVRQQWLEIQGGPVKIGRLLREGGLMARFLGILFCALLLPVQAAAADNRPIHAPVPGWVTPIAIPEPNPDKTEAPQQLLLLTFQSHFGDEVEEGYFETAVLAQQAQAVAGLGTIAIPWHPDLFELRVHKLHVIRGGEVRDVLAAGQQFSVLRREGNLESAILDGVLTATLHVEDLQVGDILALAFSQRRRPGAIAFKPEGAFILFPELSAERLLLRQQWSARKEMRWQATDPMLEPQVVRSRGMRELVVDLRNPEAPTRPDGAPPRYALASRFEVSGYGGWGEIGNLVAEPFDRARRIAAESPLRREIDRIAAASEEPRERVAAALRLVQDQVRYLALAIGEDGFIPASADETWSRKYGDCKAKTALLLAILDGLGIEAEAVLVHSTLGDALPERLPQVGAFDHVIVRARIDGRSYWLDGTRIGDRDIEELASSNFRHGLPIRAAGAELEAIPFYPSRRPASETRVTYDASEGFLGAVPVSGEAVFRAPHALLLRATVGQLSGQRLQARLASLVNEDAEEGVVFEHGYDDALGTFTVRWTGRRRMEWSNSGRAGSIGYRFDDATIRWSPDFEREGGQDRNAPFSLAGADHLSYVETVILPAGGEGLKIEGEDLDHTVAGVHIRRTLSLEDGRAVARSSFRPLALEISAEEAAAAAPVLAEVNGNVARVAPTASFRMTGSDRETLANWQPSTASEFVSRGHDRMQRGELHPAIADFEEAARLNPRWSLPLANHAIALVHQRKFGEAEAMFARAAAIDGDDPYLHQGQGDLHLARGKPVQAVASLTRSLELAPGNDYTLMQRATAFAQLSEFDDAIADLDSILAVSPDHGSALKFKARILARDGDLDSALAIFDDLIEREPDDLALRARRAEMLKRGGRSGDAAEAYAVLLAALDARLADGGEPLELEPIRRHVLRASGDTAGALAMIDDRLRGLEGNGRLLNERCWLLATAGERLQEALANCNEALASDPEFFAALDSRALVNLRLGRLDRAISDADAALAIEPMLAESLFVRGVARIRAGETAEGRRDLAAARRLQFDIDSEYRTYGISADDGLTAGAPATARSD